MSYCHSQCKDGIRQYALSVGACACGFAEAADVSADAIAIYDNWVASGLNGSMDYCAKYREQRNSPTLLLDGARTVISCAFSYYQPDVDMPLAHRIAKYAWGDDYHWVVKQRLRRLSDYITDKYGGECRVCVDTAPIRERYWAVQAGIGFIGLNNQLIVPGYGSYCFLGEVLWTGEAEPDKPCGTQCSRCMRCVSACPGKALDGTGQCDTRRCVSYLTIEHRGDLQPTDRLEGMYYGCDRCQMVCPHNVGIHLSGIQEFSPNSDILSLDTATIRAMTKSHYRRLTHKSAMSRVTLTQLIRNIDKCNLGSVNVKD